MARDGRGETAGLEGLPEPLRIAVEMTANGAVAGTPEVNVF